MTLLANINVGSSPNDGTGDSLRTSFITCNENFQILDTLATEFTSGNLNTNITSNGTSTFNVVNISGNVTSTANITASYFIGNGVNVTGVAAATANSATYAAQVTGNTQSNITTVGTLGNLTVSGTILTNLIEANTLKGSTIGNTGASIVGTLTTSNQPNITTVGTLTNLNIASGFISSVRLITYFPNNDLDTPLSATETVTFYPNTSAIYASIITSNLTLSYASPITAGVVRTFFIKNDSGTTNYVVLPNANNNKASNSIPVSANCVATIIFAPFDTTSANVFVTVIND